MAKVHYSNKHPFVVAVKWADRLLLKNICYFSVLKANKSPEIAHAWLKADYEAAPTWRSAFTGIGSWNCTTVKMHVPVTVFAFYLRRLTVFIWKVLQNRWSCSQVARWKKMKLSFHALAWNESLSSPRFITSVKTGREVKKKKSCRYISAHTFTSRKRTNDVMAQKG